MNPEDILKGIKESIIQGRRNKDDEGLEDGMVGTPGANELTEMAIDNNCSVKDILKSFEEGMQIVGEKFEKGEYFLPDMMVAGEAIGSAMEILEPQMLKEGISTKGKIVIATVKGDIHDIGKNLVALMLQGAGFRVIDLGNDVPSEKIVETVKSENAGLIGLSALLTTTMQEMEKTIGLLNDENLRSKVKVLIGGAPISEEFAAQIGADAFCKDAFEGVAKADLFIKELS